MVARDDPAMMELSGIKVADMRRRSVINREFEHLVEVTVVESAVPSDGQRVPAHDAGGCSRGERIGQARHVLIIVAAFEEELQEPADRHVGDRVEPVELNPMLGQQFFLKLCFDRIPALEAGTRRRDCRPSSGRARYPNGHSRTGSADGVPPSISQKCRRLVVHRSGWHGTTEARR